MSTMKILSVTMLLPGAFALAQSLGDTGSLQGLVTDTLGQPPGRSAVRYTVTGLDIRRRHSQIRVVDQSRSFPSMLGAAALGRPGAVKGAPLFGAA